MQTSASAATSAHIFQNMKPDLALLLLAGSWKRSQMIRPKTAAMVIAAAQKPTCDANIIVPLTSTGPVKLSW